MLSDLERSHTLNSTQLNSDAGVSEFFRATVRPLPPRPSSPSSEGTRKNGESVEMGHKVLVMYFGTACPDLSQLSATYNNEITMHHHFIQTLSF